MYGDYLEWFELDVASLSTDVISAHKAATPDIIKYNAFIEEMQRQKPHDLSKVCRAKKDTIIAEVSLLKKFSEFFCA